MKTASCKHKGRRACQEAADKIRAKLGVEQDDIRVTPSGVQGPDLQLSPLAKGLFPFGIEVKNQEAMSVWAAFEQAQRHCLSMDPSVHPMLIFKKNHKNLMVCIELDTFLLYFKGYKALQIKADEGK